MKVNNVPYRSIWLNKNHWAADIIDQTRLPHEFVIRTLSTMQDAAEAISVMRVRGAPLIGATAAYGLALAMREDAADENLEKASETLLATRPTAVNLRWALARMQQVLAVLPAGERVEKAYAMAAEICDEDVAINHAIGRHALAVIRDLWQQKPAGTEAFNILTHCNAGSLATGGYGTALGVIRAAVAAGKQVSVFADETRPFLQGSRLTAWELQQDGIQTTLICDNMAGYLMAKGAIDVVIVGADRIAANGDVANKIGTYTVAVLAKEHNIPFYVAAPVSTIDLQIADGSEIPIEQRDIREVTHIGAQQLAPSGIAVLNPAFDVTPARLVSAIITEHGVARGDYTQQLAAFVRQSG